MNHLENETSRLTFFTSTEDDGCCMQDCVDSGLEVWKRFGAASVSSSSGRRGQGCSENLRVARPLPRQESGGSIVIASNNGWRSCPVVNYVLDLTCQFLLPEYHHLLLATALISLLAVLFLIIHNEKFFTLTIPCDFFSLPVMYIKEVFKNINFFLGKNWMTFCEYTIKIFFPPIILYKREF